MIFEETSIDGAFLIELEPFRDDRGFFARTWCATEFADHGLDVQMVQASVSHSHQAGTLRGMHFSKPPSREAKLVRCSRGRVLDVILDLRPDSPSFRVQFSVELDDGRRNGLFVPPGVAHGFQTLVENCEIFYMMSESFNPNLADGVRFDDPAFGITWPLPVTSILDRDARYPDFDPAQHEVRYFSEDGVVGS